MDTNTPDTQRSRLPELPITVLVQYRSAPDLPWGKYIVGVQFGSTIVDLPVKPYDEDHKRATLFWAQEKLKQEGDFHRQVLKKWAFHLAGIERQEAESQRRAEEWQRRWESQKQPTLEELEERHQARAKARERTLKWIKKNGNGWFGDDLQKLIDDYIKQRDVLSAMENEILKRRRKYTSLTNFYEGGLSRERVIKLCETSAAKIKRMSQAADRIESERKFYDKL
jgi:hypothetical protein